MNCPVEPTRTPLQPERVHFFEQMLYLISKAEEEEDLDFLATHLRSILVSLELEDTEEDPILGAKLSVIGSKSPKTPEDYHSLFKELQALCEERLQTKI